MLGFWTVLAALWTAKRATGVGAGTGAGPGTPAGAAVLPVVAHAVGYFGLWALLTPAVFWLVRRLPLAPRPPAHARGGAARGAGRDWWPAVVAAHLGVAVAVALGFRVWDEVLKAALTAAPWPGVRAALNRPYFFDQLIAYAGVLAAALARDYFVRLQARQGETARLAAEAHQLAAQLAGARLAALTAQLNPHFLFNTLHTVSAMVGRDPDGVRRMLARLSDLLRYALDRGAEPEVPLADELDAVGAYLDILQVRFGDRLTVERRVDPRACDALVPTLVLQPLVENAVEHGAGRAEGPVRIELAADVLDGADRAGGPPRGARLRLTVRDSGPGPAPGAPARGAPGADRRRGVGLANTRARLAQLYDGTASVTLRAADGGSGAVAELVLPFRPATGVRADGAAGSGARVGGARTPGGVE